MIEQGKVQPAKYPLTFTEQQDFIAVGIDAHAKTMARSTIDALSDEIEQARTTGAAHALPAYGTCIPLSSHNQPMEIMDQALNPDIPDYLPTNHQDEDALIHKRSRVLVLNHLGFSFDENSPHGLKQDHPFPPYAIKPNARDTVIFSGRGRNWTKIKPGKTEYFVARSSETSDMYLVRGIHQHNYGHSNKSPYTATEHLIYAPSSTHLRRYLAGQVHHAK